MLAKVHGGLVELPVACPFRSFDSLLFLSTCVTILKVTLGAELQDVAKLLVGPQEGHIRWSVATVANATDHIQMQILDIARWQETQRKI